MQRRVIERLYEDAVRTGNKLMIYTNIPENECMEGIFFWSFVLNPSVDDNTKRHITRIDFNVSDIKIQEVAPKLGCTYNNYIDYSSIVSVVEVINK